MKRILILAPILLLLFVSDPATAGSTQPVSIDYVFGMLQAGLDQDEIIRHIVDKDVTFVLAEGDIERLLKAGASEGLVAVVSAMAKDADSDEWSHPRRIYDRSGGDDGEKDTDAYGDDASAQFYGYISVSPWYGFYPYYPYSYGYYYPAYYGSYGYYYPFGHHYYGHHYYGHHSGSRNHHRQSVGRGGHRPPRGSHVSPRGGRHHRTKGTRHTGVSRGTRGSPRGATISRGGGRRHGGSSHARPSRSRGSSRSRGHRR